MTASQVSQSMRDSYLSAYEEAIRESTRPHQLVLSQSVCEYCTRPNLSNSETCKGCGAPASNMTSMRHHEATAVYSGPNAETVEIEFIQRAFPYERWVALNQAHALGLINWRT